MLGYSDLENIRETLETERTHLLQTIDDQEAAATIEDNPDEEDLADFVAQQGLRTSLDQFSEEVLDRINQALERMEEGSFGMCQKCNGEIPAERLLALPYAEMCVNCQSLVEKRARFVH